MSKAETALRRYAYWIDRAREYAEDPKLGRGSELYRCAAQMAYRALGQYDAYSEVGV